MNDPQGNGPLRVRIDKPTVSREFGTELWWGLRRGLKLLGGFWEKEDALEVDLDTLNTNPPTVLFYTSNFSV